MAEFVPAWSIVGRDGDLRGDFSLEYLPEQATPTENVMVHCGAITAVDAWSFVVLRTLLEYAAVRLLIPVVLSLPLDGDARRTLAAGLGGLPNNVQLPRDTDLSSYSDANIVLPATCVKSVGIAELIASHLPDTEHSAGASKRELSYLAIALQELLTNALDHAASPVHAIAAIALEPEENELQLVVSDLGNSISYYPDAAERLEAAWNVGAARGRRVPGGLASIVATAERRGFDLSLSIYAGIGRLFARTGGALIVRSEEPYIAGFTVGVTLHR